VGVQEEKHRDARRNYLVFVVVTNTVTIAFIVIVIVTTTIVIRGTGQSDPFSPNSSLARQKRDGAHLLAKVV